MCQYETALHRYSMNMKSLLFPLKQAEFLKIDTCIIVNMSFQFLGTTQFHSPPGSEY
jgi:hypothetical protein